MIFTTDNATALHGDIIFINSSAETICPKCNIRTIPHGRCTRKVIMQEGAKKFSLRVSYCLSCKHSHRELPDFILPYKRHSAETYAQVYDSPHGMLACDVDEKTERTIRRWVSALLSFFSVFSENNIAAIEISTFDKGESTLSKIKKCVRMVIEANSGSFSVPPFKSF